MIKQTVTFTFDDNDETNFASQKLVNRVLQLLKHAGEEGASQEFMVIADGDGDFALHIDGVIEEPEFVDKVIEHNFPGYHDPASNIYYNTPYIYSNGEIDMYPYGSFVHVAAMNAFELDVDEDGNFIDEEV